MSKVTNTSKHRRDDWLFGLNPNAIMDQEAAGQKEFVESTQLPTKAFHREELEAMGIVFGEPDPDDPLFCPATLPDGWTKRATSHPMWSDVVDENGVVRARVFYKAAFYDREAHISPERPANDE